MGTIMSSNKKILSETYLIEGQNKNESSKLLIFEQLDI